MSYQAISRKWRPQSFSQMIGQTHVTQTLANAIKNNQLHHALLFTGVRGTGKTSCARILAKTLRCPNVKDLEPCHQCDECQDIFSGRSLNVIEIDGASNNGVDAIRELRETVGYLPSSGKYKLYIIDEVHMLTMSAFNALLKTLEEPPGHVIFILATTEIQKVPATILSRCQRFDFRRIPTRQIYEALKKISTAEEVKFEEAALWTVARAADGSLRDGQSLLDQIITFTEKNIRQSDVIDILGLTHTALIHKTIESLVEHDVDKTLSVLKDFQNAGTDPKVFLNELLTELHHLLFVKLSPSTSSQVVDRSDADVEKLKSWASQLSEEDIHQLFDMALKGSSDVLRAQEPALVLEMVLLRMCRAPSIQTLQALLQQPASVPTARAAAPVRPMPSVTPPTPAPLKQPVPKVEPVQKDLSVEDRWSALSVKLKQKDMVLGAKFEHFRAKEWSADMLQLEVPQRMKFLVDNNQLTEMKAKLTQLLGTLGLAGLKVELKMEAGGEPQVSRSPKELAQDQEKKRASDLRAQIENDPLIKSTKQLFNAEIESIKSLDQ